MLLVLLGIGHVIGHEGVVAQGLVLADDHQGDVVIPVVPLGEGLAVGADQVILLGKALQVLKMPVRQSAEHRRLRGILLAVAVSAALAPAYMAALTATASRISRTIRVLSR